MSAFNREMEEFDSNFREMETNEAECYLLTKTLVINVLPARGDIGRCPLTPERSVVNVNQSV